MAKRNNRDVRGSRQVHVKMNLAQLRAWAAEHDDAPLTDLDDPDTLGVEQSAGGSSAPDQDDDEAR